MTSIRLQDIMGTHSNNATLLKFPLLNTEERKNYANPDVLINTFERLSNLHKLLPNHLVEMLQSHKSDEPKDDQSELTGIERLLARQQLPKEISLSPKPSQMPSWKRKKISKAEGWKKCHLWKKNIKEPPMCTIIVRWLKKNMQPIEDVRSVVRKLSMFGPIRTVTPCGRQSAILVYEDITSACRAVAAFHSRIPGTMFHCSWQQRFMTKDVKLSFLLIFVLVIGLGFRT
ncbi:uncharacterized protein C6orf201 homolog [Perognathus longimembris pacificus]|uniref:uncharacterized protein C6orf201 homolog n=1 Tax=Perognathus longimembris pacificus TaxID=214514 RepID=UPI00201A1404|nr:uncharacterized protein C6orf201 homolog [Perognathus longimembris pacificus]